MNIERQDVLHELTEPAVKRRNGERAWADIRDISAPVFQLVPNNGLVVPEGQARADRLEHEQQPPRRRCGPNF